MKLVRDKIPELYPENDYRLANSWEMEAFLRLKVAEEAGEVVGARSDDELVEEIADLLEAVEALAHRRGISLEGTVRQVRDMKRVARGGFVTGYVMTEYRPEG